MKWFNEHFRRFSAFPHLFSNVFNFITQSWHSQLNLFVFFFAFFSYSWNIFHTSGNALALMWFCTGIVHISSWLCHICGMKFKTSENTYKKSLCLISSHFIPPWIYLGPRFWIRSKVFKASLQESSVPISIWLGLILSSTFFSPFCSPAQCHGLPAREFCQEGCCPCCSLLSTTSRLPCPSQSWRSQPASSPPVAAGYG